MQDFYEALVDPTIGIDPSASPDVVPWTILLPPSGPLRTDLGRFPSARAEARERERRALARMEDPWERAAHRKRTGDRPEGGREEGNLTVFADHFVPYVQSRISHLAELPQTAIGESHRYALTGDYDIGPALESAMLPMAGTFFAGPRGIGAGPTRPPPTGPGLPMDEASRMKRAKELGYSNERFYRGERSGEIPRKFGPNTFFSRDKEYADAFARVGGREAAEEYRLKLPNTFRFDQPVTAATYARLVRQVHKEDPARAAEMVAMISRGRDISWFEGFARARPNEVVARDGGQVYELVKGARRDAFSTFKNAGFDAIDTVRDVIKLKSSGIRSKDATFDPRRARSKNIMAGVLAPMAAGALLLEDPGENWPSDPSP